MTATVYRYDNGASYTFTWEGRRLTSAKKNGTTYRFTYTDEGLRASMSSSGGDYSRYYYEGSTLIGERRQNAMIVYIYDETGLPIGTKYREHTYAADVWDTFWYEKNLQGDVVAVYSANGTKLASYKYDAWGNTTVAYHNGGASTAAIYNPFRYRSYYYDVDLELYLLGTRLYDPAIGRFINADTSDVLTATPDALTDKNLFAYCDNNPVMRVDYDGEFWNYIIGGVVGAVVGGVVAALNGKDTAGIIIDAFAGMASGVVAATGLGLIAQASVSAGISAMADFANQTVDIIQDGGNITDYNIAQTVTEAGVGFITSAVGTMLGNVVDTKITKNLVKSNGLFDQYLEKTFSAGLRKEAGKSTSALIRQANKFLGQSNYYLNVYRGVSSVLGSGVSLWNIAR